jgi:hypothetical protein
MSQIEMFYTQELKASVECINKDDVNLTAIARNNDVTELINLMKLILGAAFKSDMNVVYISRMQTLEACY